MACKKRTGKIPAALAGRLLLCSTPAHAWMKSQYFKTGTPLKGTLGTGVHDRVSGIEVYLTKPDKPYVIVGLIKSRKWALQTAASTAADEAEDAHVPAIVRISSAEGKRISGNFYSAEEEDMMDEKEHPISYWLAIRWAK